MSFFIAENLVGPVGEDTLAGDKRAIAYMATNSVNGKRYIGITSRPLYVRVKEHCKPSVINDSTRPISRAINKYGIDQFRFTVLAELPSFEDALLKERRLVKEIKPEYNATKGGDGILGFKFSTETLEHLSKVRKGRAPPLKGKKHSPESIAKMSAAAKGRPGYWNGKKRDPETIVKIVQAKTGRRYPAEFASDKEKTRRKKFAKSGNRCNLERMKPVICLDDGKWFPCASSASEYYGFSTNKDNINKVCRGANKTTHGLTFRYADG